MEDASRHTRLRTVYHGLTLVVLFLAFALFLPAQTQRYSTYPKGPKAHDGTTHVKNALDYTSDGEFVYQSAESNDLLIDTLNWAKDHASDPEARRIARDLLAIHTRFADDIRRIANRKHITLPLPAEKTKDGPGDDFFMEQVGAHIDVQSGRFANEAKAGKDTDIRRWAESELPVFDRARTALQKR